MKKRILTGDRPTGKLHLGHYVGSLKNRIKLQDEYEQFIMLADVQALTDNFENPEKVRQNIFNVALDYLSVGIDPKKSTIFIQSQIPGIAELTVFYMNLVTVARLERNPTVKTEIKQKGMEDSLPLGFLAYPVSQAADITIVKSNLVPVGEDQLPMIEQTREIVRKFNFLYGDVFPEPEAVIGDVPRLVGIDGSYKMSKSLGNAILLSDSASEVEKKVMSMYTDPNRIKANTPGSIEGNPLFIYLDAFAPEAEREKIGKYKDLYRLGQVGDIEVKKYLSRILNEFLDPIRNRRLKYENNPKLVEEILKDGTKRVGDIAQKTMGEVKKAMKIDYFT